MNPRLLILFFLLLLILPAHALRMTKYFNMHTPDGFQVLNSKVEYNGTNVTVSWNMDTNFSSAAIFRDGRFLALVEGTNTYTDDTAISNYVHQYTINSMGQTAGRPVATLNRTGLSLTNGEADRIKYMLYYTNANWIFALTRGGPAQLLKITPDLQTRSVLTFTNDGLHTNGVGLVETGNKIYCLFDSTPASLPVTTAGWHVISEVNPTNLAYTDIIAETNHTYSPRALATDGTNLFVLSYSRVPTNGLTNAIISKYLISNPATKAHVSITNGSGLAFIGGLALTWDRTNLWAGSVLAQTARINPVTLEHTNSPMDAASYESAIVTKTIAATDRWLWMAWDNDIVSLFEKSTLAAGSDSAYQGTPGEMLGLSARAFGEEVWVCAAPTADTGTNRGKVTIFQSPPLGVTVASQGTNFDQFVRQYIAATNGHPSDICTDGTNKFIGYYSIPGYIERWSETVVDDVGVPTGAVLAPTYNALVSGTTNIVFRATDNLMLSHANVRVDFSGEWILISTVYLSGTNSTNSVAFDTTEFFNGFHTIWIELFDAAGNPGTVISACTISNHNPNPGTMVWASNIVHTLSGTPVNEAVAIDFSGANLVVGGNYEGSATFAGSNVVSAGKKDVWFATYNTNGVRQSLSLYTNEFDAQLRDLDVDVSGNIFIGGHFERTLNLGTTNLTAGNNGDGAKDIFLAKYNSSGVPQWSRRMGGGSGSNFGRRVKADSDGNVLLAGEFAGTSNFGGTNVTSSVGTLDVYLSKYSSSGAFQWHKIFTGPDGDAHAKVIFGLAVDGDGNSYVVGQARTTIDFGSGLSTSAGGSDGWVVKINSSGALVWATMLQGNFDDGAESVCVSGTNVFVAGQFRGSITLGSSTHHSFSSNSSSLYLVRLSTNSGAILQSRVTGGSENGISITTRAIAVDSDGNIVLHGTVSGDVNFGNGVSTDGLGNIFLVKYNSDFECVWFQRPYSTGFCGGYGLVIDGGRTLYGVGRWAGTGTWGGIPLSSINTSAVDGYLFKSNP